MGSLLRKGLVWQGKMVSCEPPGCRIHGSVFTGERRDQTDMQRTLGRQRGPSPQLGRGGGVEAGGPARRLCNSLGKGDGTKAEGTPQETLKSEIHRTLGKTAGRKASKPPEKIGRAHV